MKGGCMAYKEKIIELINEGKTVDEIKEAVGCSIKSVYNTAYKNGLQVRKVERRNVERDEQARRMREAGMSFPEIANILGMDCHNLANKCRKMGVGYTAEESRRQLGTMSEEEAARRFEEDVPGFVYVGGYVNNRSEITVRCKACGTTKTVNYGARWQKPIPCKTCKDRAKEREAFTRENEAEKARREKAIATMNPKQVSFRVCERCRAVFVGRSMYCSVKCARRAMDSKRSWKKDRRINAENIVDKEITLEAVAKRDGNVCWLCGLPVDWDDIDETRIYAGNMYPSIDHVVPLAKGGKHAWGNVRLAHRICNTMKGDKVGIV